MHLQAYITELDRHYTTGQATEHTYRPALKTLLESFIPDAMVTNEPKRIDCGAPDFVLTRNHIPLGYVEAKDIDKNLNDKTHTEQLNRYTESLDNLIFTNYREFRLLRGGERVAVVNIAGISGGRVRSKPGNFKAVTDLLTAFAAYNGRTITTAADLAGRMAVKARMLAAVIAAALRQDTREAGGFEVAGMQSAWHGQMQAFRKHLIHDLDTDTFTHIYAQTVAYGLFAARLHDQSAATFSRQEAAERIPANNPFLRKFFQHIAGYDLDERIRWIVDDLADVFRAADVGELMKDYGKATQRYDPFLHFYETFLAEYDPKLRKSRGVYYTPEPVVSFILRAVDDILRTEFNLPAGLADTSKSTIDIDRAPCFDERSKIDKHKKEVHNVQILDPATGTGTFLAAIVQQIYETEFTHQKGIWPDYVRNELIPRLNGFEVLMAPYAMAHAKLEMVLRNSGCDLGNDRLRLFLTNSLEEHHPDTATLFAQWLSTEANEANFIKRDTPVMVVIGNPPYAGESANKGKWIMGLLADYKQEPGGGKLKERNAKWINDDYVKFIRYGQHHINRTGEGVLAYVNNHSFLDNLTFRGMRWSLLQSFDTIYILDLHGNAKKKETAPDGSADKNVFDIQQGVCINLFVKTGKKNGKAPARVFHYGLYGTRERKYRFLWENELERIDFEELTPQAPQYFFVPKDYGLQAKYDKGFSLYGLFLNKAVGIVTARDSFTIHRTPRELQNTIDGFLAMSDEEARETFSLGGDTRDWTVRGAREDLLDDDRRHATAICYRPFDMRYTCYTGKTKGFHCKPRREVMQHFLRDENVGLVLCRQFKGSGNYHHAFITKSIFESSLVSNKTSEIGYGFPLYIYPGTGEPTLDGKQDCEPNLDANRVQTIATVLGLRFTPEKEDDAETFAPIDLLDYIYAVLHSPSYRTRYKEFLKIDFPRVPYPMDKRQFRKLVKLGSELRALHLLESPALDTLITGYPEPGDNTVTKPKYHITDPRNRLGKVSINNTQYVKDVPETAWNFHIGSYQPAQKYLKDRKDRVLNHEDIIHYQKIIVALTETGRLMDEVENVFNVW
ncbi:hypothetical protein NKDENANG_01702 [Candidatus Entotheonellaceae bacterium PAL068K]